jgi:hypothetical protein
MSPAISAEIGAASNIAASGSKSLDTVGCCVTQASTSAKKAVLNGKASAVAINPPYRNAAANSQGVSRSRRSRNHGTASGTAARTLDRASARACDIRAHAREQAQMDKRREYQHYQQHPADHAAYSPPPQRGA